MYNCFGVRKQESLYSIVWCWLRDPLILIQYGLVTGGQTHDDSIYRTSIALCSKNC